MTNSRSSILLLTCEHGGHEIPPQYLPLFGDAATVLEGHRGWDPGALELADALRSTLNAPLFHATTSRLLIELNRSLDNPTLFSEYTRGLSSPERQHLIDAFYQPYRSAVQQRIATEVSEGRAVLHLSVHSFTPVLNGETRDADIGLLFDPARPWEASFSDAWTKEILQIAPGLRVRMNYPYLGTDDGFTTYLRTKFTDAQYAGIELEVNQRFPLGARDEWLELQSRLTESLARSLNPEPSESGT